MTEYCTSRGRGIGLQILLPTVVHPVALLASIMLGCSSSQADAPAHPDAILAVDWDKCERAGETGPLPITLEGPILNPTDRSTNSFSITAIDKTCAGKKCTGMRVSNRDGSVPFEYVARMSAKHVFVYITSSISISVVAKPSNGLQWRNASSTKYRRDSFCSPLELTRLRSSHCQKFRTRKHRHPLAVQEVSRSTQTAISHGRHSK